jgi:hypothetical protein
MGVENKKEGLRLFSKSLVSLDGFLSTGDAIVMIRGE